MTGFPFTDLIKFIFLNPTIKAALFYVLGIRGKLRSIRVNDLILPKFLSACTKCDVIPY